MLGLDEPYSEEELQAQNRRDRAFGEIQEVTEAIADFTRIRRIADAQGALTRTVLMNANGTFIRPPKLKDLPENEKPTVLLRIVASHLGKLTFRPTLRDSLALRHDPATQAMRTRIADWIEALRAADLDEIARIRSDVRDAVKQLAKARTAGLVGDVATWIAVPAFVADTLMGLPGILGGATTVTCVASQLWRSKLEVKHRWAMFGEV